MPFILFLIVSFLTSLHSQSIESFYMNVLNTTGKDKRIHFSNNKTMINQINFKKILNFKIR